MWDRSTSYSKLQASVFEDVRKLPQFQHCAMGALLDATNNCMWEVALGILELLCQCTKSLYNPRYSILVYKIGIRENEMETTKL